MTCPQCTEDVPYRIRNGQCISCHDREYLASGVPASQWIADHIESAAVEEFAMARKWRPES